MSDIIKLSAKGKELPADSTKHAVLVINGLRIDVRKRKAKPHAEAMAEAAAVDLLGATWRPATVREIFALADITNPDGPFAKSLFPNFPEYGWIWASDAYARDDASSPVCAWGVGLGSGFANIRGRGDGGLALPVSPLAASASQS